MKPVSKLDQLKKALKDKNCIIQKHSRVMEITFEKTEDAEWFESIFEDYQRQSAVSCLMTMRGANARHKFVFNVKDMDNFIKLLKEE